MSALDFGWREVLAAMRARAADEIWARWRAMPFTQVWLAYKPTTAEEDGKLIVLGEGDELEVGAFYVTPEPVPSNVELYQLRNWLRLWTARVPVLPLEGRTEGAKYVAGEPGYFHRVEPRGLA